MPAGRCRCARGRGGGAVLRVEVPGVITVAIADDHRVVRVGLEQLLATFDDVAIVGAAAGGEEAVEICGAHDARRAAARPVDARHRRGRGDAPGAHALAVDARRRVHVVLGPRTDRRRARRRGDRVPVEGRRARGDRGARSAPRPAGRRPWRRRRPPRSWRAASRPQAAVDLTAREREVLVLVNEGLGEQADRPASGDQREDRERPPHEPVPADRGRRPDAGGVVGGAERHRAMRGPGPGTTVALPRTLGGREHGAMHRIARVTVALRAAGPRPVADRCAGGRHHPSARCLRRRPSSWRLVTRQLDARHPGRAGRSTAGCPARSGRCS